MPYFVLHFLSFRNNVVKIEETTNRREVDSHRRQKRLIIPVVTIPKAFLHRSYALQTVAIGERTRGRALNNNKRSYNHHGY